MHCTSSGTPTALEVHCRCTGRPVWSSHLCMPCRCTHTPKYAQNSNMCVEMNSRLAQSRAFKRPQKVPLRRSISCRWCGGLSAVSLLSSVFLSLERRRIFTIHSISHLICSFVFLLPTPSECIFKSWVPVPAGLPFAALPMNAGEVCHNGSCAAYVYVGCVAAAPCPPGEL